MKLLLHGSIYGLDGYSFIPVNDIQHRNATYKTAKYLNTLLTPLTKSQYNILSTDDFIQKVKRERICKEFKMISFDVKSLFANVRQHQSSNSNNFVESLPGKEH